MATTPAAQRENWGSRMGFLLAAAGSAIGLGNIWRFTYIMGENGGAAFILVYLICIALIGVPVFLAELVLGRASRSSAVGAFRVLAPGSLWIMLGRLGVVSGFLVLSFYSVVAGWILYYLFNSLIGVASSLETPEQAGEFFAALSANGPLSVGLHAAFMVITIAVVARGVRGGIERLSKTMMPILLAILVVLIVRGLWLSGSGAGVAFLLTPDWSRLTPVAVLTAMGHAFFTLSVGMGAMITYGSYLPDDQNMPRSSLEVAGLDTVIAIAAGFAIFPALFALGMEPAQGPGLIFVTLPVVFSQLTGGTLFATLFFALVFMAAITSSISMLEVVAAYFIDERGWGRTKAAWSIGAAIFVAGIPAALATGAMSWWSLASMFGLQGSSGLADVSIFNLNWFDLVSHLVSDYMLAVGGVGIALFVGWSWGRDACATALSHAGSRFAAFDLWRGLLRWVVPLVAGEVLLLGILGEFPADTFPRLAGALPWLRTTLTWFAVAVTAVVVAAGVRSMRRDR